MGVKKALIKERVLSQASKDKRKAILKYPIEVQSISEVWQVQNHMRYKL